MGMKFATGALPVFAAAVLGAMPLAMAEDAPVTGVPEESIAQNWNDPVRAAFAQRGITYGVNWSGEYWNVAKGGNSQGSNFDGLLATYTDIDLDKLTGWKGATIHASAYYLHGVGASTERVNNIFAVSNIEGLETFRLFELWFEQSLLQDKLKVRIGSLAADSEFFISDSAALFLNGTFGWPGVTAANMAAGGPGYPLASLGVRVQYAPTDNLTILAAVFNGSPADPFAEDPQADNRHGTEFRLEDAPLLMLEGQFKYNIGNLPGTLKLGAWQQLNHYAPEFLNPAVLETDHGLYAIVDQQIWKSGEDKNVSIFARVSGSPESQSLISAYVDTGIVFTGFVPGRAKDSFGAAFGYGNISNDLRKAQADPGNENFSNVISDYESVLEVNYIAQICPGISIVPDFQYIWNPGGRVSSNADEFKPIPDAAVFGVRTNISY
jgi:porin